MVRQRPTRGAPGLVMRPCMVEIDRNYCLKRFRPSWRQFQGSMARTDGQTDGGDNHNEPVNSQLTLPTKHKLYVSGCGTIYTNCIRNYKTLRESQPENAESRQLTNTGPKQLLNAVIGPYQSLDWKD
ncbi:hypothetical protein DPMN_175416 [Dreissena polymorpha]|uniref:Uncharacterized protein n=1 Tax=Dreissena polymorpha TaxID=45954 RepID=A0A9D4E516_DREPO|nr:hypothetical protein DPMN_193702 [Dreissena polymorpha]KAH3724902.1 hypothetical protein DPMN_050729 [Dreissena polymorpha]KAH3773994.1 hypothetical protein DPMN_175365 [Dreissena polymorpha]KAH3774045.1 hypothetical protein DPMN_175416 [Dreissena polymorpha]